ncbi:MAG TPA: hypothetical protein VMA53_19285, partial [Stellaceae bacterium]|nr:hypothetical protein [Stellaceae bacterium]
MKAARAAGIIERFPFPTGAELRRMKPQSQLPFDAPRLLKRADRAYRLIIDRCEKGDSELAEMLDTAARTGLKRL